MRKNVSAQVNFFGTLHEAVDAIQERLTADQIVLVFGTVNTPADDHWTQQVYRKCPISYGQTVRADFEILTRRGKSCRAWFHIQIWRSDTTGTYELNTYAL